MKAQSFDSENQFVLLPLKVDMMVMSSHFYCTPATRWVLSSALCCDYIIRLLTTIIRSPFHPSDGIMCVCMLSHSVVSNSFGGSPPGSHSVHGIFQARILEWVAISSSRGSSPPRDQTCISCVSCTAGGFFTAEPFGEKS